MCACACACPRMCADAHVRAFNSTAIDSRSQPAGCVQCAHTQRAKPGTKFGAGGVCVRVWGGGAGAGRGAIERAQTGAATADSRSSVFAVSHRVTGSTDVGGVHFRRDNPRGAAAPHRRGAREEPDRAEPVLVVGVDKPDDKREQGPLPGGNTEHGRRHGQISVRPEIRRVVARARETPQGQRRTATTVWGDVARACCTCCVQRCLCELAACGHARGNRQRHRRE